MDGKMMENGHAEAAGLPDWSAAPAGWNWAAQDGDGQWFWYRTQPVLGLAGRVWRCNSRNQRLAGRGEPNPDWALTLRQRPGT